VVRRAHGRARGPRSPQRRWPDALGQDLRLARHAHQRARHPRWSFTEVRRAALALAREVECRIPALASSKWWKEERHGVFLDYNQNAKDRTTASAYSVRPLPDARVSAPIAWDEANTCDPADFTIHTMPARFARIGDPHAAMDETPGSLDALLELAARDEASGIGDAPWPRTSPKPKAKPSASRHPARRRPLSLSPTNWAKASAQNASANGPTTPMNWVPHSWRPHRHEWDPKSPASPPIQPNQSSAQTHPKAPLLTIAQSPDKSAAESGLARWKEKHPVAAAHLAPDDVLTDRMRGASTIWYRIRVNLRNVPEDQRPMEQTPDPDDDPTRAWREQNSVPTNGRTT